MHQNTINCTIDAGGYWVRETQGLSNFLRVCGMQCVLCFITLSDILLIKRHLPGKLISLHLHFGRSTLLKMEVSDGTNTKTLNTPWRFEKELSWWRSSLGYVCNPSSQRERGAASKSFANMSVWPHSESHVKLVQWNGEEALAGMQEVWHEPHRLVPSGN